MDDSISRNYCSQPLPVVKHNFLEASAGDMKLDGKASSDDKQLDDGQQHQRMGFCFSQPAMLDDMLLCTQMNQTQSASQNVFQRLVRRMTRFFVTSTRQDETIKLLVATIERLGYTSKVSEDNLVVTISTIDRRKLRLVFKAYIIEMDGKILLDFRLSKGCGLEFKRRFIKIKNAMEGAVLKGPVTWPIAIATNCVP